MLPAVRASLRILVVALALAGDSQAVVDGVIDPNAASSPWGASAASPTRVAAPTRRW